MRPSGLTPKSKVSLSPLVTPLRKPVDDSLARAAAEDNEAGLEGRALSSGRVVGGELRK